MGDSLSSLYDDYNDYLQLCKKYKVKFINMHEDGWLNHLKELEKRLNNETNENIN